jgi:hypothetical protein
MRGKVAINGPAAGTLGGLIEGGHSGSMSIFVDNDDLNDVEKRACLVGSRRREESGLSASDFFYVNVSWRKRYLVVVYPYDCI